jgi:tight adherence protein B
MDGLFLAFAAAIFLTAMLLMCGVILLWNVSRGTRARRIAQRLQTLSGEAPAEQQASSLLKQRHLAQHPALDRLLSALAPLMRLDRLLQQAGAALNVARFCLLSLAVGVLTCIVLALIDVPGPIVLMSGMAASGAPLLLMMRKKQKRLARIGDQLPDALDLMSRALRAGHALPSAIRMAGEEMPEPIGREFRIVADEVNYGVSLADALKNLAARVPGTDVGYFVVAVLIQRETGGNLTELLGNISTVVRERMKLFGQIRVLSAEGRFSAWILTLLPFIVAGFLQMTNRQFLNVLWTDPGGRSVLFGMLSVMAFGVLWMRKVIRIRV